MLVAPPQVVPLRYLVYAAHAQWLVETYQPKVLINERNGSLHAPFLRLALAARGARLLHLAHATTLESSRRLGMNDYDYYGVFGAVRWKPCKSVDCGSVSRQWCWSVPTLSMKAMTCPSLIPASRHCWSWGRARSRKESGYEDTYRLLRDWAGRNPHYRLLFKRHPRSKAQFWIDAATRFANIELLDIDCSLAQALAQASVVVNIMSNAGIEAGLAGRPVIHVNAGNDVDIFSTRCSSGRKCATSRLFPSSCRR